MLMMFVLTTSSNSVFVWTPSEMRSGQNIEIIAQSDEQNDIEERRTIEIVI